MANKILSVVLKLGVVGVCFFLIARKLNLADIPTHLKTVYLPLVLLALLTVVAETFVLAAKWNVLLKEKGMKVPFFALVRVIFVSNFLGVWVPGGVGMDAIRIYMLKQKNNDYVHTTGTLIADRLMAVASLAFLSLLAIPVVRSSVRDPGVFWVVLLLCLGLMGILALVVSRFAGRLFAWVSGVCLGWLGGVTASRTGGGLRRLHSLLERGSLFLSDVHASVRSLTQAPRKVLLAVFLLNGSLQLLRVVQVHCLFRSIGVAVPVMQELAFVPVILMAAFLPISFFGLGIKDGAFVFFFGQVGVPSAAALTVSLITYPLIFLALIPGGLLLLTGREAVPKKEGGPNL